MGTLKNVQKFLRRELLFCDIHPVCFDLSMRKEHFKRQVKDWKEKPNFATRLATTHLPHLVDQRRSNLIKRGPGLDLSLQEGKAHNIDLANQNINGLLIEPGQEFSFWKLVGAITPEKGYLDGRVIREGELVAETGGGLCNLANTINLLIIHSPLTITELHTHSDALAPDEGPRKPFANGTSVAYSHIDYRFKNETDQTFQLLVWNQDEQLRGELRSQKALPWTYELVEEGHHFKQEGEAYYRKSKIYKVTKDKKTGQVLNKELLWDNRSKVMYDPALIPQEYLS